MKKYKFCIQKKQRLKLYEYAVFFNTSNDMLDFACNTSSQNIFNSKLYTKSGTYQMVITAFKMPNKNSKFIIFEDRLHLAEIKSSYKSVCKTQAIEKIKKAFLK